MLQEASALERIIQPASGTLPAELAAYLLQLDFPPQDQLKYEELSEKAQSGTLSEFEQAELDDLLTASEVLSILQSKARVSLRHQSPAA